jgi:hypothetical protein
MSTLLISAGAGMAMSGVGAMITGPGTGREAKVTATRNPIKPWDVGVGQNRHGGTLVYLNCWPPPGTLGPNTGPWAFAGLGSQANLANNFCDMVFVLPSHRCQSIDAVLFDGQPLSLDPTAALFPGGGSAGQPNQTVPRPTLGFTSYTPTSTTKQSTSITRSNGVITVVCPFDIPSLQVGFTINLFDKNGNGLKAYGMVGTFIVQTLVRVAGVSLTFTVLSGGVNATVPNSTYTNAGWVTTGTSGGGNPTWPNYKRDVYVEYLMGDQLLGDTFTGITSGTPFQGTGVIINPNLPTVVNANIPSFNYWTNYCSLQGKTAVFIRLYYEQSIFYAGVPAVSFLYKGKADIYDPRLGDCTGLQSVALSSAGAGGYAINDVIALEGSSGPVGNITLTGVATVAGVAGTPTSWVITRTGAGYSLNATAAAAGGSGSGATFLVTRLGGISSSIVTFGIEEGGQKYNFGDVLQVGGTYGGGSLGFIRVVTTDSNGAVTDAVLAGGGGYGYTADTTLPTSISGGLSDDSLGPEIQNYTPAFAVGSGTGCTVHILTVYGGVNSSACYTTNAALVAADYLANSIWGYGAQYAVESATPVPFNNIGIEALTTAANVCDQQVELAIGQGSTPPGPVQYESMYAANGHFDLSMKRGDVLKNILSACAGRFLYVGGIYSIIPGYWVPAGFPDGFPIVSAGTTISLDLSAIACGGEPEWKPNVKIRELFNGVKGTYVNPSNKYEPGDFPAYCQDALHGYDPDNLLPQFGGDINLAVDLGIRRWKDIHFPFTISASMAQRLAKIELLRGRNQEANGVGTGTFPVTLAGYQCVPWDILSATSNQFKWTVDSPKLLEVTDVSFVATEVGSGKAKAIALTVRLEVQETSADIYSWSIYEELSPEGYAQATEPAASATEIVPFPWSPGAVAPLSGDALFPAGPAGPASFGMQVVYGADAQGNATAGLAISGANPINALDKQIGPPFVSASALPTGGTLAPGTYVVGVTSFNGSNAGYKDTPYLDLATVVIAGGEGAASVSVAGGGQGYHSNCNLQLVGGSNNCVVAVLVSGGAVTGIDTSVYAGGIVNPGDGYAVGNYNTVGGSGGTGCVIAIGTLTAATATGSIQVIIDWGPGDDGGDLYVALETVSPPQYTQLMTLGELIAKNVMHWQQTLGPTQTVATITSFNASTPGGPDTLFDHYGIVWQKAEHTGDWAEQVQALTATTVTIFGPGMTYNQWAGYTLSLLAHYDPTVPVQILNMPIASSTASGNVGGLLDVNLSTSGTAGYSQGDVLTLAGGTGGEITVNAVDGSGNILAWAITAPGADYVRMALEDVSGGTGTGAQFVVSNISTGFFTLTIGPNSASDQLPDLTTQLSIGDVVTVFYNATFTPNTMTDPNIANGFYPSGDLATEAGMLAIVLTGIDAGDVQPLAGVANAAGDGYTYGAFSPSNPAVQYVLAGQWQVTPNPGDVVIIAYPINAAEWDSGSISTPNKTQGVVAIGAPNVQNLLGQVWLFTVKTEDSKGNSAPLFVAPARLIYLFGAQATRYITAGISTMLPWDGLVIADCTGGNVIYNCLPASTIPNQKFTVEVGGSPSINTVTVQCYPGDAFQDGTASWMGTSPGMKFTFKVHG